MNIQWIFIPFALFALSRVLLRLRDGVLSFGFFLFWAGVFIAAIFAVLSPEFTTRIAQMVGIGRGADVIIYASLFLLFYLVFRLYVLLEEVRREITELIRQESLKDLPKSKRQ